MTKIKKIIIAGVLLLSLTMPIGSQAMTEIERNQLIIVLIKRLIELQTQLLEMLREQQATRFSVGMPVITQDDNISPTVSLSDWKNKIENSFIDNDWCDNGGIPCGTLGLSASYNDPAPSSGIAQIMYYVDGKFIGKSPNGNKVAWDSVNFDNGEHVVLAMVYDKAGNYGENSVKINILNKK